MSKRLDLAIEEKEGTSHQTTLMIGGIGVINKVRENDGVDLGLLF
jgi:hypothetical protein